MTTTTPFNRNPFIVIWEVTRSCALALINPARSASHYSNDQPNKTLSQIDDEPRDETALSWRGGRNAVIPMPVTYKTIDVRKLLAKGTEPLMPILQMRDSLQEGEGLEVIAPFLPSPLIEKLKGEGFLCRPERHSDGCWVTRFWRE